MNEPQTDLQNGSVKELNQQCAELRRVNNLLFGALIITSFTLTAYLGLEGRRADAELSDAKQRATQSAQFIQQDVTDIKAFYSKLSDYAHTHPDFQNRVLSKFRLNNSSTAKTK